MSYRNYYKDQLKKVLSTPAPTKVQFASEDKRTNWLNINLESIEAIRDLLTIIEIDLTEPRDPSEDID